MHPRATISDPERPAPEAARRHRRGRAPLMGEGDVLALIRSMNRQPEGLFRVHRQHPDLYARARRMFGSWSAAVVAAGIDYQGVVTLAAQRSLRSRRNRRDPREA